MTRFVQLQLVAVCEKALVVQAVIPLSAWICLGQKGWTHHYIGTTNTFLPQCTTLSTHSWSTYSPTYTTRNASHSYDPSHGRSPLPLYGRGRERPSCWSQVLVRYTRALFPGYLLVWVAPWLLVVVFNGWHVEVSDSYAPTIKYIKSRCYSQPSPVQLVFL